MANSVSTSQIIDQVAERAGLSKSQAKQAVSAVVEAISTQLTEGNRVQMSGFGTFEVRERAERQGTNPRTREKVTIAASRSVGFRPSSALKSRLGAEE
jgi:predicted histone-like DNA-binding protein